MFFRINFHFYILKLTREKNNYIRKSEEKREREEVVVRKKER